MARKRNTEPKIVVSTGSAPARARRRPARAKTAAAAAEVVTPPAEETSAAPVVAQLGPPSSEEIARLAYSYWEARGCQGGSPEEDWLRAERELLSNRAASATA